VSINGISFFGPQQFGGPRSFNAARLPVHQFHPNSFAVQQSAAQLLMAMQQLQAGLAGFGGAPFVPGFQPEPVGFPNPVFQTPSFGGGFAPQPFPMVPAFQPQPLAFPPTNFPSIPFGGAPLAGGGASLADQARLLQAGVSDSLIAGNIGAASGGFAGLAGARGAALAGPFLF